MEPMLQPFNIDLLMLKDSDVRGIKPVKVLDIFDGLSKNFHPDGLFSTEIFGKVGEEKRNRMFSYIELNIPVLHPKIYKSICDLKALYEEILAGKTYAIFDKASKDFIKSDPVKGRTGYAFFMENYNDLEFEERESPKRETSIALVNKYRKDSLFDKFVVLPAGLRDYEIDENGKPSEDEINTLYRRILSTASIVSGVNVGSNLEYLNASRYNLQLAIAAIYDYLENFLSGKGGFVQSKWGSRKVYNSTRNVITSYTQTASEVDSPVNVSIQQTVVGLYQSMRSIAPLAVHHIRDGFLSKVFTGPNSPAVLINKTTFRKEVVNLNPEHYDNWMTNEGIEKLLSKFSEENIRHDYIEIEGYYLGLMYKGEDTYRFVQDVNDIPDEMFSGKVGLGAKELTPITYTELLYLSVKDAVKETPCLVTRYPVSGYGSIYPSFVYLKTTARSEVRYELDDNWQKTNKIANEFPKYGEAFFNSVSPAPPSLGRLAADGLCYRK
jgi:hypothetical protein